MFIFSCGPMRRLGVALSPTKYPTLINLASYAVKIMSDVSSQGLHSLEKSLNFKGRPWKVLEFHFSLKSP